MSSTSMQLTYDSQSVPVSHEVCFVQVLLTSMQMMSDSQSVPARQPLFH